MTDISEPIKPEIIPPDPGAFTSGSMEPAMNALSLKDRLRESSDTQRVSAVINGEKRRPGRPKGSVNQSKIGAPDDGKKTPAQILQERKSKKDRAEEIASSITGELNDTLMKAVIAQGLPAAFIYKKGYIPPSTKSDEKYTEIGQKLAVDAFTASMVGSFIAEIEVSDTGANLIGKATGGSVGLVVKGLVALVCVAGYVKGIKEVLDNTAQLREGYKEYQRQEAMKQHRNDNGGTGNVDGLN